MVQQKSHQIGPDGAVWDRKIFTTSVSLYERDLEILGWLQENLGCSRAEAVRTSIRAFAMQVAQIPGKSGTATPTPDSINSG